MQALIRTVIRLFEANPFVFGGISAAIFVGFTKANQRLGDLVAGTYVVIYKDLKAYQAMNVESTFN